MAKKRKSDAARLEEVDRSMFSAFSAAANSLSQLYSQATSHHKLSFHAGERHALDKLSRWIVKRQEEGSRVTSVDIIAYLQRKLDYSMEGQSTTPSAPSQQSRQPPPRIPSPPEANVHEGRSTFSDLQTKNVFSDALSSPVRRSLQQHHLAQSDHRHPDRTELSNDDRGTGSPRLHDSLMDMSL